MCIVLHTALRPILQRFDVEIQRLVGRINKPFFNGLPRISLGDSYHENGDSAFKFLNFCSIIITIKQARINHDKQTENSNISPSSTT